MYIGPKSRTERPRKTKIGKEVAHVTRDSDTTFKVKMSKVNLQGARAYCGCRPYTERYVRSSVQSETKCLLSNHVFSDIKWLSLSGLLASGVARGGQSHPQFPLIKKIIR